MLHHCAVNDLFPIICLTDPRVDSLNFGSTHLLSALYLMHDCHYIKDYYYYLIISNNMIMAYFLYIVQTPFHKLTKCMHAQS